MDNKALKQIAYLERKKLIDKYENKVICFLDILGISKFIENNKDDEEKICELYSVINRLIYTDLSNSGWIPSSYFRDKVIFSSLSDSVIISFPINEIGIILPYVTRIVACFQCLAVSYSLPLRGVMTYGKIHHVKDSQLIFGHGLVNAYQQERKNTHSPRVVIDSRLLDKYNKYSIDNFNMHLEELRREGYQVDIKSFFNKFPDLWLVKSSIENLFRCHRDVFDAATTQDIWHNLIYSTELNLCDEKPKLVTKFFDQYKFDLIKELKKKGTFKFARYSIEKAIQNNLQKFSDNEELLRKWKYLELKYDNLMPDTHP
jgi:hypothetical protein